MKLPCSRNPSNKQKTQRATRREEAYFQCTKGRSRGASYPQTYNPRPQARLGEAQESKQKPRKKEGTGTFIEKGQLAGARAQAQQKGTSHCKTKQWKHQLMIQAVRLNKTRHGLSAITLCWCHFTSPKTQIQPSFQCMGTRRAQRHRIGTRPRALRVRTLNRPRQPQKMPLQGLGPIKNKVSNTWQTI